MNNRPPIEHYLDEGAVILTTDDGFALETPLVRVNLSDVLVDRLVINALAARRRAEAAS